MEKNFNPGYHILVQDQRRYQQEVQARKDPKRHEDQHTFMRVSFSMSSFWDDEDKLLATICERGKEHKFVGLTKTMEIPAAAYLANKIYMFALRE